MCQLWQLLLFVSSAVVAVRIDDEQPQAQEQQQQQLQQQQQQVQQPGDEEPFSNEVLTKEEVSEEEEEGAAQCLTCNGGCVQHRVCFWKDPITHVGVDVVSCEKRGGHFCEGTGGMCRNAGCGGYACLVNGVCEPDTDDELGTPQACAVRGGVWCTHRLEDLKADTDDEVAVVNIAKDHARRHEYRDDGLEVKHQDVAGQMAAQVLVNNGTLDEARKKASDTAVYLAKWQGGEAADPESLAHDAAHAARDTTLAHGGSDKDADQAGDEAVEHIADKEREKHQVETMEQLIERAVKHGHMMEDRRIHKIAEEISRKSASAITADQHASLKVNKDAIAKQAAIKAAELVVAAGGKPDDVERAARAASTKGAGGEPAPEDVAGDVDAGNVSEGLKTVLTTAVLDDKYQHSRELEAKYGRDGYAPKVYGKGAGMKVFGDGSRWTEQDAHASAEAASQQAIENGKSKEETGEIAAKHATAEGAQPGTAAQAAGRAAAKAARADGDSAEAIQEAGRNATSEAGGSEANVQAVEAYIGRGQADDTRGPAHGMRELRHSYEAVVGQLPPVKGVDGEEVGAGPRHAEDVVAGQRQWWSER